MVLFNLNTLLASLLLTYLTIFQVGVSAGMKSRFRRMTHCRMTHCRRRRMVFGEPIYRPSPIVLIRTTYYKSAIGMVNTTYRGTCSGSLISETHVLSAAHCFTTATPHGIKNKFIKEVDLYVGGLHSNEFASRLPACGCGSGSARFTLRNMYIDSISIPKDWYHSLSYKQNNSVKLNDIAVIRLPGRVDLRTTNGKIATLFAPSQLGWYSGEIEGTAMGWGKVNASRYSSEYGLRKADIKSQTLATCKRKARALRYDPATMSIKDVFCGFGMRGSMDSVKPQTCFGDTGGPLFIKHARYYNMHLQFGINVWTDRDCNRNFNGFLRIANHIDFIKKAVGVSTKLRIATDMGLTEIGYPYNRPGGQ